MRVHVVDPSAFTPFYDHALCTALSSTGLDVELVTSRFAYGSVTSGSGYAVRELFYRRALGRPGSRLRLTSKLAQHVPDMLRYRCVSREADVVHFQWLTVQPLDVHLMPRSRPLVLTAHDVLPREPRPGQLESQRRLYGCVDAVVVHSEHGRRRLTDELGVAQDKVRVIPIGAMQHLQQIQNYRLPTELSDFDGPVVLFFGLLRPYKGVDVLLDAWRNVTGAQLWIVGLPRFAIEGLRSGAPPNVRWVSRYVDDTELAAVFRRADLVVAPYREIDQSGVVATALAFAKPMLLSNVGGFPEIAATGAAELVPPGDRDALSSALRSLLDDPAARAQLAARASDAAAPGGPFSWDVIAAQTRDLYESLGSSCAASRTSERVVRSRS